MTETIFVTTKPPPAQAGGFLVLQYRGLKPKRQRGGAILGIEDGEVISSFVTVIILVFYILHDHFIGN